MANNMYGCPMTEKLPVDRFKWLKNLSKIDEKYIKKYDKDSNKGFF